MEKRLLITGAGAGASNNLIRSLRAADRSLFLVGCHHDRFLLKKSSADRNYLVPRPAQPGYRESLQQVMAGERIDLLIPNSDADVRVASRLREELPCRLFLPRPAVIALCQDKYDLTTFLRSRGLPAPATYPVTDLDGIDELFGRLSPSSRVWCRIRTGSGSMGATPIKTAEQARAWIGYWADMRGVPATDFTLSEYLPGRDFACQSLWKDGDLVLIKTTERLSYLGGGAGPSGVSSVGALHKTVYEPRVVEVSAGAIRALDPEATGAFSVDLKEDASGTPCITEINVGRLLSGTTIFDLTGKHNMALTYVRLAFGEPVDIGEAYDVVEDYYMVRDLDTLPDLFHADQFFEGIVESRADPSN
ncbi:MAG TPA: hypothetical protein VGW35_23670 [Methylomirabilota bacterium]|jgi:carbamoyl-phosphate synthase large subunit|nr:hypothetical protein [Methylomirabilota bacterium]